MIFAALRAGDVIGFIKQLAASLSPARAKAATKALRSFFRYLRYCGEIQLDLAAAVPTVPNWSMTGIPRLFSAQWRVSGSRRSPARNRARRLLVS